MKNTVVLKEVKSNLVEEAIIVFKENVKIKEKQLIKGKNKNEEQEGGENIALIEAENVILDYIEECEDEKKRSVQKNKIRALKIINISLVVLLIFSIIF
ncbi:MAG: hypothetical protein IKM97_00660 [Clostridia bacterium]|nr:hypothetical protein [Clostridia bacterium]